MKSENRFIRKSVKTSAADWIHAGGELLVPMAVMALSALAAESVHAASSLETFVLAVGGESNYSTFGAPQPVFDNFGALGVGIPSNPAGLAASNVGGDYQDQTQTNSPLLATYGYTSGSWVSSWANANSYSGSAAANARYGQLGATASGSYTGWSDTFTVAGSEAMAIFTEQMTITSPTVVTGTPGSIRFSLTVDGSMTTAGDQGQAGIQTFYKLGTGPSYGLVNASVSPGGAGFYPFSGAGRAGFTITATNIAGQGSFDTFDLPFTFGVPIDLKVGLLAYNTPGKNNVANVNFGSTVKISAIQVNGVSDFVITAGSGTAYGTNGVLTVSAAAPKIVSAGFNAGAFKVLVTGLDPTRSYRLERSQNLGDGFPTTVDGPRQPANASAPDTDTFTDLSPVGSQGFYRIESLAARD